MCYVVGAVVVAFAIFQCGIMFYHPGFGAVTFHVHLVIIIGTNCFIGIIVWTECFCYRYETSDWWVHTRLGSNLQTTNPGGWSCRVQLCLTA